MENEDKKESLIVSSKTRAYIKSLGFNASQDALDRINDLVYELIEKGTERTKENKRSTLRPHDL